MSGDFRAKPHPAKLPTSEMELKLMDTCEFTCLLSKHTKAEAFESLSSSIAFS